MKNFKFKWLLLSIILSIASINTAWATKRVWIDVTSAPSGYTSNMIVQYYVSSSWTSVWAQSYGTVGGKTIYYADIADGATKWQVYRGDDLKLLNTYNWQHEQTYATNNKYTVTGWDNSGSGSKVIGMVKGGYMLFDNSKTNWSYGYRYFVIGHDSYYGNTGGNESSRVVTNTKLWCIDNNSASWPDAKYYAFLNHDGSYPSASKAWSDIDTYGKEKTSQYTDAYSLDKDQIYLCVPASGSGKPTFTINWQDGYSDLNKTVTLKAKVSTNGGSTYSETNTPGALSATSYKFSDWKTCGTQDATTTGSVSAGSASGTFTAGYTANTSVSAADVTGYDFVGWYEGSTLVLDGSRTGTMNPHGAVTLYAYYKVKQYTVSYGVNSSTRNGNITLNSGSAVTTTGSSTLNHGTSISFTASPSSGYQVEGWYSDAACSSNKKLQSGGTSYNAGTLTAATTVYVKFEVRTGGTVTVNAGSNGEVSLDNSTWGSSKTKSEITTNTAFNIYARGNTGYAFSSWTKNSGSGTITSTSSASTTFTPVAYEDAAITASFTEISRDITIVGGTVYGSAATSTTAGVATSAKITANAPADGKKFTGWSLGDGVSLKGGYNLTDRTIEIYSTADATVTATYADRAGVKMYFAKPATLEWGTMYAYAWKSSDESVKNAAYPGVTLSTTEDIGCVTYYIYQYYTEADGIGGAATGNSAWNRVVFGCNNDAKKTDDLTIADGHYYYRSSTGTGETSPYSYAWYIKGTMNSWDESAPIDINCSTHSGSVILNLTKGTKYEFKVYTKVDDFMWSNNMGLGDIKSSFSATTLYNDANSMYITPSVTGAYKFTVSSTNTNTPQLAVQYPTQFLKGSFNSWTEDDPFDSDGYVSVHLEANEDPYTFKVYYNNEWYGCDASITSSVYDYDFSKDESEECKITVSKTGDYKFGWNATNKKVSVVYPDDQARAVFTKESYVYFDMSAEADWKANNPNVEFWFKNFLTAVDIDGVICTKGAALDTWVYYAAVPDNDFVGRIQMNRLNPSDNTFWNNSIVEHAHDRSNTGQNCLVAPSSGGNDIDLTWSTYCPPMSSATLSDNSTTKIDWQDGGNDGSTSGKAIWVSTSNSIKVSGSATKAVNDDNMTINYDFKVDGSSAQAGSGNTYSKGSLSNNTLYTITMQAYNTFNGETGTKLTASQTLYYKALDTYTVTHTLSNVTKASGRAGDDAAAYHVAYSATYTSNTGYCLPSDITVSIGGVTKTKGTDYTWTVTSGTSGSLSILTDKIEGNVVVTVNGVVKYAMYGSLDDNDTEGAGMSGWSVADNYTYNAGSSTYTLVLNLTKPNTTYKFRVLDHNGNVSYGMSTAEEGVIPEGEATLLNSTDKNAHLATAGTGNYTFTVVENEGYPQITIVNPASHQITYGIVGDGGSWTSVVDGESNAIATGQYVKNDGSIIFTANPSTGYRVEGWYSNSDCSTPYTNGSDGATVSGAGNTVLALTVTKSRTVYVKIIPVTLTFNATTDATWNTASNWSPACVPTIEHDVVLSKPVTVNVANAKAKSVLIDQNSGNTGKLTVDAGKALVVATTIQKKNAGGSTVATEETDIVLESDGSNGTGALVAGSASTTTKATVHFYSKAKKDGSGNYINQYFGTPMDSVSKLNYYGSYLQKYDQPTDSWVSFTSEDKLGPWTAYRIMRSETTEGTYQIGGTLLLPGTGAGKTKTLTLNTSVGHDNDNMFANSWAAPISIAKFDASDFTGATATIYIFKAGSAADYASYGSSTASKDAHAGQWIAIPVSSVKSRPGDYDLHVIPSQQAFLVQASGTGAHSLALDYKKLVYDTIAGAGASIVPTCAPQRLQANDLEVVGLYMTGESGLGDRVLMYVRDDFSADEMDNGWEAYKLPGSEFAPQLCAYSGLGEMSISATNVIEGTVLGFYAGTEDSEYTFTFGYEGDNVWYLNDLEAQQSTLISAESSYNFVAVPGTVAERRFVISHTPIGHVPTGIDNSEAVDGMQVRKQMINGILYIIRGGQIYSTDGQIVK